MDEEDLTQTVDHDFRETLEKFRVDIVQTLDLERHFIFAYLRSNSVFDEEDCDIILSSGPGRKQKVAKFLDVLVCKGQEGFDHFKASLAVEHPNLYEKITGKRPEKRLNPVESLHKFGNSLWSGGLAGKDLIDFDRQYLATQLEKTAGDLKMLSHVHSKIVHEKNALERKVLETSSNLEDQQQEVQELREQLKNSRGQSLPNHGNAAGNSFTVQRYIQELMAENADKSNRIISLQQSLLDAVENSEKDRASFVDLQRRHEEILQQLRDVTINYDWERRNSIRMSEKMRKQSNQIKIGEDLRREIFDLKLKLSEMQDQRDEARDELREFRNVTEALSAKFDSVRQEKEKAIEFQEECSSTMAELQEESQYLQAKLQEAYLDLNDMKRKNMRLTQESRTHKEQRDVLLQEREIAINERNASMKDLEEALRLNQELRKSRDDSVEAHIKINKMLQDDYNKLHEEMDVVRHELRLITEENERLRLKVRQCENARNMAPLEALESAEDSACTVDKDSALPQTNTELGDEAAEETSSVNAFKPFPWKKSRSNTAVLNSAYKRINEPKAEDFSKHRASLPAVLSLHGNEALLSAVENSDTKNAARFNQTEEELVHLESQKPKSDLLKIDVKAARALSDSESPNSLLEYSNRDSGKSIPSIVPLISGFSMNLAMSSGSQESLHKKDRPNSPPARLLRSPEPRSKQATKSFSPKVLYKIDRKSAFDFPFPKKILKGKDGDQTGKKQVDPERTSSEDAGKIQGQSSSPKTVLNGNACENSSLEKTSAATEKSAKVNRCATVEQVSLATDFLDVNLPKRRHSSADLISLSKEEGRASDV